MNSKMNETYDCQTTVIEESAVLRWHISNYSKVNIGKEIHSDTFNVKVGNDSNMKIQLTLNKGYTVHGVKYDKFSAVTLCMGKAISLQKIIVSTTETKSDPYSSSTSYALLSYNELNDSPTLSCAITYTYLSQNMKNPTNDTNDLNIENKEMPSVEESTEEPKKLNIPKTCASIIDDFENLYLSGAGSDFTFIDGTCEYKAHKAILSCRSPFLTKITGKVNFWNLEPEFGEGILDVVLYFIYTGKPPKIDNIEKSIKILQAAIMWELQDLKSIAESFVISQLNIDFAPSVLILADTNSMTALRKETISFIIANAEEVGEVALWREMMKTHPHLIAEVTFQMQVANVKK